MITSIISGSNIFIIACECVNKYAIFSLIFQFEELRNRNFYFLKCYVRLKTCSNILIMKEISFPSSFFCFLILLIYSASVILHFLLITEAS